MSREQQMVHQNQYKYGYNEQHRSRGNQQQQQQPHHPSSNYNPNKPLTVTHVTQDPITNQLLFQKETIQKTIFRPSWNQPTMSLSELADKEVQDAKERGMKQRIAEQEQLKQPRRYELLVKDGLEDDAKLVDASAKIDREWDDWKDENPRGSGNKMGDVGDRNF